MSVHIDDAIERTKIQLHKEPSVEGEKFLKNLENRKDRGMLSIGYTPMPVFLSTPPPKWKRFWYKLIRVI